MLPDAFATIKPHLTRTGQSVATLATLATLAGLPVNLTADALAWARVRGLVGYDKAYNEPYTYVLGSH